LDKAINNKHLHDLLVRLCYPSTAAAPGSFHKVANYSPSAGVPWGIRQGGKRPEVHRHLLPCFAVENNFRRLTRRPRRPGDAPKPDSVESGLSKAAYRNRPAMASTLELNTHQPERASR